MQSFNNFTYKCRRQTLALVFYSGRQTDKPAFDTETCAVPFAMFGRMALSTHRDRGMK